MDRRKSTFLNDALVTAIMISVIGIALFGLVTLSQMCHGQCGHGDKQCQERCFAKGECPMEVAK